MAEPRFSIVIPTRQRPETLHYTLMTCLEQDYEDYEIIVMDNCGGPETRAVVEALGSDKIVYFRSDVALAMSDNWELGLSHARGEYVTVLGDDDGLMPFALERIDHLVDELDAKILRWNVANYYWPDVAIPKYANRLTLPVSTENRKMSSRRTIYRVANGRWQFTALPMIYRAAIHRDLIAELKSRTGRVFKARAPDIYSGFAFAYLNGSYWNCGVPMGIAGAAAKSTGIASSYVEEETSTKTEFQELTSTAGLHRHPQSPEIISLAAGVADEFLWTRDRLFPNDPILRLDRKRLIRRLLVELEPFEHAQRRQALEQIHRSLLDRPLLARWFMRRYLSSNESHCPKPLCFDWETGFHGGELFLDLAAFDIEDVYQAALFCRTLLGEAPAITESDSAQRRLFNNAKRAIKIMLEL